MSPGEPGATPLDPIAIVGIGCRFPGARGPGAYWRLLAEGRDAVSEVPFDRWDLDRWYSERPGEPGHMATRRGGFLDEVDRFDAGFFRISAEEAARMDPQQRLLLEVAYETLMDAGVPPSTLAGRPVGVFVGISNVDYSLVQFADPDLLDQYSLTGVALSIAANRISYLLDLRGPSLALDTACSSSLVAVHQACGSLRAGECEAALVGGVNLMLSPMVSIGYSQAYADSPEGVCRAFDAGARGAVRGEGAGVVLLRPLAVARARGERIHALIRGSAVNQDGLTNGLAAPSPAGQRAVLRAAYAAAGVDPGQVDFVEAHGTGTILGDPIEASALGEVLGGGRRRAPCLVGSVKTNIGHLEAAAGIAGLLKAALALEFGLVPPSLHFRHPNPRIDFPALGLEVPTVATALAPGPRRAGVSSFGFGGTNAHVVLESLPPSPTRPGPARTHLVALAAHGPRALGESMRGLAAHLAEHPALEPADLCRTLLRGRDPQRHRVALPFADAADLGAGLAELLESGVDFPAVLPPARRKLVFVFPGMGSQQPGMGTQLLELPAFQATLEACERALQDHGGLSLRAALEDYAAAAEDPDAATLQPLLLAVQLGMAAVWRGWGVEPDAVVGTSIGEVAAATVAGALDLEDAFRIVCRRVPILRPSIGRGGVAVAGIHHLELEPRLEGRGEVWVAARNSPHLTAFSGRDEVVDELVRQLRSEGLFSRRIRGAVAPSHSPLMEPFGEALRGALADLRPRPGRVPLYSTVTGERRTGAGLDADYWWRNIRQPIELARAVAALEADLAPVYLEMSPHPVLAAAILDCAQEAGREAVVLGSMEREARDVRPMLASLGRLHALGWPVPWDSVNGPDGAVVTLPPYPWQGEAYWLEGSAAPPAMPHHRRPPPRTASAPEPGRLDRARLRAMSPADAEVALLEYLGQHVARALDLDPATMDPERPLKDMGVGSLMGMELYGRMRRDLGVALPTAKVLAGPSLRGLARLVLEATGAAGAPSPEAPVPLPEPEGSPAPLSFAQERLWFLEQLEPARTLFVIPIVARLRGPLDTTLLATSLEQLMDRHHILRSVFPGGHTPPVQVVRPSMPLPLVLDDLGDLPEAEQHARVEATLRQDADTPFDLERGPLFRIRILRLSDQEHLLGLTAHHLIMDGWSLGIWLAELGEIYRAQGRPGDAGLDPLPLQYAQFARAQRRSTAQLAHAAGLEYWRDQLRGAPPETTLPLDRPRPEVQDFQGGLQPLAIPAHTRAALEGLARAHGCSLFALLLAAFEVLLHRHGLASDLVVGSPVLGRDQPGLDRLIGVFVNMVPLRVQLDGDLGFAALMEEVQRTTDAARAHGEVPFETIVEALDPPRSLARSPLFQVVFALHAPLGAMRLGDCAIEKLDFASGRSQVDLTLTLFPSEAGLEGGFEYATSLFQPETVARLAGQYRTLLEHVLEAPETAVGALRLDQGPRRSLAPPAPAPPPAPPVPLLLEEQVRRAPEAPAVRDGAVVLRYRELWAAASRIAAALGAAGVRAGDLVAVMTQRSPFMIASWIGAWQAGAAFLPLDLADPWARRRRMLEGAQPAALVVDAAWPEEERATMAGMRVRVLAAPWEAGEEQDEEGEHGDRRAISAYLLYTSGSTGVPKGVEVGHDALAHLVAWHREAHPLAPGDRVSQVASPAFDAAVWEVFPALAAGACLCLAPDSLRRDPRALRDWLLEEGVAQAFVPTPMLEAMLPLEWPAEAPLERILTGGDRLTHFPEPRHPFRLFNHYGPTEATVVATWGAVPTAPDGPRPSIGRPLPGVCLDLVDQQLRPVPDGTPGEVLLRGPRLARGYRGDPEATRTAFVELPQGAGRAYRTGDHARWRADGSLDFLGRRDQQVKIDGVRLELGEVEACLEADPEVAHALVGVHPGPGGEPALAAWVVPRPGADTQELAAFLEERQRRLRETLPPAMVPRLFACLPALPRTGRGKVDRTALPPPLPVVLDGPAATLARGPLEAELAALYRELLGLPEVPVDRSFFELGGRSLLAVQLMDRIERQLGVRLPLATLFQAPTVAGLAARVAAAPPPPDALPELRPDPGAAGLPFPMTEVQEAYWVGRGQGFELGGVAAHAYLELDCPDLDLPRLEAAVRALVARHDMLRAVVEAEGSLRVLAEVPPLEIPILDLGGREPSEQLAALEERRSRLSHEVRDATSWPLFSLEATLLGGGRTRLHLGFDALVADAASLILLARELGALYRDPATPLRPLTLGFRDHVLALVEAREGAAWRHSLAHWKQRIATLPPAPELPLARQPGELAVPRFRRLTGRVEADSWGRLQAQGAATGLTPTSLLLTAFAEVLARWSRSPQFTLALTIFDRPDHHPDLAHLVGDFTNLLLLGVDRSAPGSFRQAAEALQGRLWEDLEHRRVSGVRVLRELARARGPASARLPVVFTAALQDGPDPLEELGLGESVYSITQTPQVWLDHQVFLQGGALVFQWDAPEGLFPEGLLEAMHRAFGARLEQLAADPEAWTGDQPLPLPPEQLASRQAANATATPRTPACLHQPFLEAVARAPDRVAVRTATEAVPYGQLERVSSRVAAWLHGRGLGPGEPVGVALEKGWQQVAVVLGILRAGGAYVPLNPTHPRRRREELEAALDLRWTLQELPPDLPEEGLAEAIPADPGALAYVIFTSGSTGVPKGVMMEHAAAGETLRDIDRRLGLGPGDAVLGLSSLEFDLSVWDLFGTLGAGATLVLPDPGTARDPGHWAALMERHRVTIWNSVPTLMKMLLEHSRGEGRRMPPDLRAILLSGDWIPTAMAAELRQRYPEALLLALGGATEAAIWSVVHPIDQVDPSWRSIPYGVPLANQGARVLDPAMADRPLHVPGRLYLSGAGLARGYWGDEARTRERFVVDPRTGERLYDTGDMACYRPDGRLEFLGREDHQVKIQGHRVELGEVEAKLCLDPRVAEAVVVARERPGAEKQLVAYVRAAAGGPALAPRELEAALGEHLPCHMVPSRFVAVESFPHTAGGKVDRSALPDPEAAAAPVPEPVDAGVAARLGAIVREVLDLEALAPDADLLALGANSVDVVRLANRIQVEFGACPTAAEIFRLRTVDQLARHLARAPRAAAAGPGLLLDPAEREAFKGQRRARRQLPGAPLSLEPAEHPPEPSRLRSHRHFLEAPVSRAQLGALLAGLRADDREATSRLAYGSAGGLYPVQLYLVVHPGGGRDLAPGSWYYHPGRHALWPLDAAAPIDRDVHFAMNQAIFDGACFSLFLVADMDAIEPLYGSSSRDYCLLEAGAMAQILRARAPEAGLGLCAIGELDFPTLRPGFRLHPRHQLLHSLLGGVEDPDAPSGELDEGAWASGEDWEEVRF